jgi:D-alanine--(R)-lactate ligase
MDKLRLLILYGGLSEEHPVSLKSARELSQNLDAVKYDPIYVFIDRNGLWHLSCSPEEEPQNGAPVALSTDRKNKGLVVLKNGGYVILPVDAAFPMLHGRYGEDGTVQGILKMSGIPYVGCGVAASALFMDKALTYLAAAEAGVRVPRHRVLYRNDEITAGDLKYPIFVKPARSGSSFGVSKVCDQASLPSAVNAALKYDGKVLLEEAVAGSEVGCAVMGNGSNLFTGALDQIELSGGFFRIHQEAKPEQGSENAAIRVPAPITEAARALAAETAKTVYRALGCRGLARVDLFLKPDGQVVLNEVNSMPGFTSYSRYPRMMAGAGIPLREVIDRLVALALEEGDAE